MNIERTFYKEPKNPEADRRKAVRAMAKINKQKRLGLPVRKDVKEVEYHRNPTKGEIRFGYGAIHYRTFPLEVCCHKGTRILKKWFKAKDDGLRYYR